MDSPVNGSQTEPPSQEMHDLPELPNELWGHTFKEAKLHKLPLVELLPLRTVCTSWNKIICNFPKINSSELKDPSEFNHIFGRLRELSFGGCSNTILPDLHKLTGLHTLNVNRPTVQMSLNYFSKLTNLTKLKLSSGMITSLENLTFLQCLHLKMPCGINDSEVLRLPHLTTLMTDGYVVPEYRGHVIQYFGEGEWYDGFMKDGMREGPGRYYHGNGDREEGIYENDELTGQGTYHYANGARYVGEFKDGVSHGRGVNYFACGDRYEGMYANDMKHGYGSYYYQDEKRYEGEYHEDSEHGQGTYYYKCGGRFEGTFKNGERTYGMEHFEDGSTFEGRFEKDLKNGFGIETFPDGERFEGNFVDDDREGHGIAYFADGSWFEGNWSKGVKNGIGIMYSQDGTGYEENFIYGEFQKPDDFYYAVILFVGCVFWLCLWVIRLGLQRNQLCIDF